MTTTLVHVGVRASDIEGKIPEGDTIKDTAFKVEDPDGISVEVTAIDAQWPGPELKQA